MRPPGQLGRRLLESRRLPIVIRCQKDNVTTIEAGRIGDLVKRLLPRLGDGAIGSNHLYEYQFGAPRSTRIRSGKTVFGSILIPSLAAIASSRTTTLLP